MLQAEVKKNAQKTRQTPKTIFTSLFIYFLTNVRDLSFFNYRINFSACNHFIFMCLEFCLYAENCKIRSKYEDNMKWGNWHFFQILKWFVSLFFTGQMSIDRIQPSYHLITGLWWAYQMTSPGVGMLAVLKVWLGLFSQGKCKFIGYSLYTTS